MLGFRKIMQILKGRLSRMLTEQFAANDQVGYLVLEFLVGNTPSKVASSVRKGAAPLLM